MTMTKKGQAFIVSLYAPGERRPSDCYGDFLPTRSMAHAAGDRCVAIARAHPDSSLGWVCRYTVRKISGV